MMKRLSWFVAAGMFLTVTAEAPGLDPPESKPAWWKDPPGGTTRLIHRSFKNDPNQPADPDYDRNGYEPDPADNWINHGTGGTKFSPPPRRSDWGDGRGLLISEGSQLTFEMDNWPSSQLTKLTFTQMAWKPQTGNEDQGVDMTVHTWDGDQGSLHFLTSLDDDGWFLDTWTQVLSPQPEWEDFKFEIKDDICVDSIWIGVHCVLSGDSNFDRLVDDNDLSLLLAHWLSGDEWETGDYTCDGTVDDNDLSLLLANWTASAEVPEPMTPGLLAAGAVAVGCRMRRRV